MTSFYFLNGNHGNNVGVRKRIGAAACSKNFFFALYIMRAFVSALK